MHVYIITFFYSKFSQKSKYKIAENFTMVKITSAPLSMFLLSDRRHTPTARVADPGGVDPDPSLEKNLDPALDK